MRTFNRARKMCYCFLATGLFLFASSSTTGVSSSGEYTVFAAAEQAFGIPKGILSSICFVESGHKGRDIFDTNGRTSYGVCQIQLRTASFLAIYSVPKFRHRRDFRFVGGTWLPTPTRSNLSKNTWINAMYAGAYLRYQYDRYGSWDKAIAAYNQGHWKPHKQNRRYVAKVNYALNRGDK